jgi:predicted transposase YbfD/YdcC
MPGPRGASLCISCPPSGAPGAGCFAVGSAAGRWASRQRLVLGQEAVAGKSNEIKAIPLLLERLALTGALVTIDAIGCQTKIARAIQAKGADYLLAVKANWPALYAEIVRYFADTAPGTLDRLATTDGDHGRIEVRRHAVTRDVSWLATDRRFPGEPRFPGLAAVGMVEATVERDGKTSTARRYYLPSAPLDAATFARAVRAHWGIENRLHWVLDVVFHDDLARLRTGHGPENMATVKHMAMNLVRQAQPTTSLKNRRKKAAWNPDYLETLLRQTA